MRTHKTINMFRLFKRKRNQVKLPDRDLDDLKNICRILFIDDKKFKVVEILENSGWKNTKRVKDVESLDSLEIRESHIIFVDVQGVGKKLGFKDEGLGLVKAIKEKYGNKKVIVYSAEDEGKIEAFNPILNFADARISKNTDPYEFQVLVESFTEDLFGLESVVNRLQTIIKNESGIRFTKDEIESKLIKIKESNNVDITNIASIFNLSNAGSISSIIQLFLQ